ncbi:acyltransferase family protein [Weissella cibaria]|uniref:acyltransferase family protein n=1 Tax=Weissella cibaria TaxID=137591 RepID=UPI0013D93AC2|nr:acyltransferase family protein [Weissella cibaria]
MNRKNYDLVDLSKFILAILVVSIHAGVPVAGLFGRLAVPYFFIVSGYFYFKKYNLLTDGSVKLKSFVAYSKRIAILLFVWTAMYLPLIAYKFYLSGNFSIVKVGFLTIMGRLPGFEVAWYLSASILGLGILLLMVHFMGAKLTFGITILFELFFIALCGYHGILVQWNEAFDSGLINILAFTFVRSWFYLMVGYWLSIYIDEIKQNLVLPIVPILCVFLLEFVVISKYETGYGGPGTVEFFGVPVLATCVAIVTLKSNFKVRNTATLRRLSTFIYLSHFAVLNLIAIISEMFLNIGPSWVSWIVATVLVIAVYFILSPQKKVISLLV